jgi:hypothetical protein
LFLPFLRLIGYLAPMFQKRIKKTYPEGTFIPKPARIVAILHLSLAFTLLLGVILGPFLQDYFTYRKEASLYEFIMGQKNEKRFKALPTEEKEAILLKHQMLKKRYDLSFLQKTQKAFTDILKMEKLTLAWLILSIAIPIFLLKKREGAAKAAFLLPLLSLFYLLNHVPTSAENPFPSEKYIIENYLKEPLGHDVDSQYHQLLKGWQHYLIDQWSHNKDQSHQQQIEEGEFYFHLHRMKNFKETESSSLFTKMIYLAWNLFFAIIVNKFKNKNIVYNQQSML